MLPWYQLFLPVIICGEVEQSGQNCLQQLKFPFSFFPIFLLDVSDGKREGDGAQVAAAAVVAVVEVRSQLFCRPGHGPDLIETKINTVWKEA